MYELAPRKEGRGGGSRGAHVGRNRADHYSDT